MEHREQRLVSSPALGEMFVEFLYNVEHEEEKEENHDEKYQYHKKKHDYNDEQHMEVEMAQADQLDLDHTTVEGGKEMIVPHCLRGSKRTKADFLPEWIYHFEI